MKWKYELHRSVARKRLRTTLDQLSLALCLEPLPAAKRMFQIDNELPSYQVMVESNTNAYTVEVKYVFIQH